MSDNLRTDCPACNCPDQHVGMNCGFCGELVPLPADAVTAKGTVKVEEVIGFRAWTITRTKDGKPRLCSPVFPMEWEPGRWEIATCRRGGTASGAGHSPHSDNPDLWPPVKGCGYPGHGCGFYAGRTREHLVNMGYGAYTDNERDLKVIGRVQMAGKVIPATNGWRAQKCRPRTIYVPYEFWQLAAELKEEYGPHGCEVEVGTTMILPKDERIEWCQRCGAAMQDRGTTCGFCGHVHN